MVGEVARWEMHASWWRHAVRRETAMGAVTSDREDFIPSNMDELAQHYYGFIIGMVRKLGIPDQEAQDSAQYILERLDKTGAIGQFDPGHLTEHQGRQVRTRFSTFLGAKVMRYCLGERGRLQKRAGHELLLVDAPVSTSGDGDGTPLLEILGAGAAWDDYSALDAQDFITHMREHLAAIPPRSARDTCDLVALFDELVAEVEQTGQFTYAGIQERFKVSGTTAGAWLSRLRQVLSAPLGRPAVTIHGVALTNEQVADAVKVLREAPGIMVGQPLEKAGHPLARAAKGWYHPFAREEMKKFPGLVAAPGSHAKPAGNVKAAVLHRLERVLSESGVLVSGTPAPEVPALPAPVPPEPEPVTAEEELEAALWQGVRDVADLERVKALAQRVYAVSALCEERNMDVKARLLKKQLRDLPDAELNRLRKEAAACARISLHLPGMRQAVISVQENS